MQNCCKLAATAAIFELLLKAAQALQRRAKRAAAEWPRTRGGRPNGHGGVPGPQPGAADATRAVWIEGAEEALQKRCSKYPTPAKRGL